MNNMPKNNDKKDMVMVWARINLYYALEHRKLVAYYNAEKRAKQITLNN